MPWARLFQDGIRIADSGFPMPRYLHAILAQRPELAKQQAFAALYFSEQGTPLAEGTKIRNPILAVRLRALAGEGADAFYKGAQADRFVAAIAKPPYPGTITFRDLADYRPKLR